MANEELLAILKQGVTAWNRWRLEYRDTEPDFGMEDLSMEDLSRAHLNGVDLSGVDFGGIYLSGAHLSGARLCGACLCKAVLSDADLSRADLSIADLRWADLSRANLSGAVLCGADLNWADLSGTNVGNATLGGTSLGDVDLSVVKGLETVRHFFPSTTIGIDTIYKSKGKIPEVFLRGCGVPDAMIAFIASLAGHPETSRIRLRMMINELFNESELQDLCFDMSVDYEGLKGESKSDKARELVTHFQRRGTIHDLVAKCKELRPNFSWEGEYE